MFVWRRKTDVKVVSTIGRPVYSRGVCVCVHMARACLPAQSTLATQCVNTIGDNILFLGAVTPYIHFAPRASFSGHIGDDLSASFRRLRRLRIIRRSKCAWKSGHVLFMIVSPHFATYSPIVHRASTVLLAAT